MYISRKKCGTRIMLLFMCLFLVLSNFITADASEEKGIRKVKAGIFFFDGYHMKDENGNLTGYGIEFLRLASQYSHLNFTYTGYDKSWNDMLTMLENGEIDLVTSARRTPEREEKFAFSRPIGRNSTILSVRTNDNRFYSGNYESYNGIKIGLVAGSSQNQQLKGFAQEKGFSYQAQEYENMESLSAALQNRSIDAILSSDLRRAKDERVLDTLATENFYAIVRKEDTALLEELNYAIEQMNLNEGNWINELFYQYYTASYSRDLVFTEREQAYIQEVLAGKKTITVASAVDRAPYSYVENGKSTGIMPDYFKLVMEIAGLPYETVVPKDREEYYRLQATNGVDVIIDSRVQDLDREENLFGGFSTDEYLTVGVARVTREDFTGNIKIVAVAGEQGDFPLEKGLTDNVKILKCATREETVKAVLNGKADAAYLYTYTAQLYVSRDLTKSLQYSVINNMRFAFKMYVRENCDHELVTILNKCIRQMPEDMFVQLIRNYTSYETGSLTLFQYMRLHPETVIGISIGIFSALIAIIVLLLRAGWSRKVLRITEQANRNLKEQFAIVEALSRDYLNVYALNVKEGTARVIKMEGYEIAGLKRDTSQVFPYMPVIQRYAEERVHPEDRKGLLDAFAAKTITQKLESVSEYVGSYRVVEDGKIHNFQYTFAKTEESSAAGGFTVLSGFRNIDELVRREQTQKELLAEALVAAQHANRAKTAFLNNMSHDIRTPMNAIIGFTSLAATHIDNREQVKDYLDKIMTSGRHLLNLINDVLDMSRIESGKVSMDEKETNLLEMLQDLKTIVQSEIEKKQLEFYIDILNVRDEMILCDRLRFNQVLLNIVSNSMKYTKPGGTVRVRVIQTDDRQEGYASYQFRVKDTGIGMSEEFLKRVFEPFEREQTTTVSGIQGTGLGLAITKSVVDMMHGSIQVHSKVGEGTEFIVDLRFRTVGCDRHPEEEKRADRIVQEDFFVGRKILLAEDNEINQEIAKAILEEVGFEIDVVDDGTEAVERIAEVPADTYDLVLMDIQMPRMNGYEATRRIRQMEDPARAAIPIVAMTANAFEEDRQLAISAGMNGHAAKPIDVPRLLAMLRDVLAERDGRAG